MIASAFTVDALEDLLNRKWQGAKAFHEAGTYTVEGTFELIRDGRMTLAPESVTRILSAPDRLVISPVRELVVLPPTTEFALDESADRLVINWFMKAPHGVYAERHKLILTRGV
jgi:hypothetical protein